MKDAKQSAKKSERYRKQKVFDQALISKTKIKIEGESWLSYFARVYSKCMGFGEEAQNHVEIKIQNICSPEGLYADKFCGAFVPKKDKYFDHQSIINKIPGAIPSAILSAIAIDEMRKQVAPVPEDIPLERTIFYSMLSADKFRAEPSQERADYSTNFNAVIVGAGGIGTYAALLLALEGVSLTIYDFDHIEEHNLNRQFLYEGFVGANKAITLSCRLEEIAKCNAKARPARFEHLDEKADIILSCVDNWRSRKDIFHEALKNNVPVIDGGVHTFGGQVEVITPENIHKKLNDISQYAREEYRPFGCTGITESNIVTNNGLIGAVMAAEAICLINNLPTIKKFKYSSKNCDKRKFVQME